MNPTAQQNHNPGVPQPNSGIGLDDIYFTVFRHKRILLACLCLGMVGAVAVRYFVKPLYSSEAKLLIRYVIERTEINPSTINPGTSVNKPDMAGESIMNSEVQFFSSLDLAKEVAERVGPEKILAIKGGGSDLEGAAGIVNEGIMAVPLHRSDVIDVFFYHPDSKVVQPVLDAVVQAYLHKHMELRQSSMFDPSYYSEQLGQTRKRLAAVEEELKKVLTAAKVISVVEAKRTYSAQIEKWKNELITAKAELFARKATFGEEPSTVSNTNAPEAAIPPDKLDYYATVLTGLEALAKRERDLIVQYREAHPLVTSTRESIAQLRQTKAQLEKEYPGLSLKEAATPGVDSSAERAQIRALAAKVATYEDLLSNLQSEALNLLTLEPTIKELERQRDQEAENLAYVSANLNRAREEGIGGNKVTGINVFQKPTPPNLNDKKRRKKMIAVFGGFLALGVGIAALIDFVVDRSIKRPVDVRRHMRLPFFLAIPDSRWNPGRWLPRLPYSKLTAADPDLEAGANGAVAHVPPPWDYNHHLRLYAEGLRERLITYFEVNGMNHKPKLVGVTSCGAEAGVTTLASGLAAALSKTGDGNVLLVDMNVGAGTTHSFHMGKPGCGMAAALEPSGRAEAQVQENLYLATMNPGGAPGTTDEAASSKQLPSRFNKIMPQLKTSDYDYVIFDMPPVTPTSVTPRLANNMDMVLLVLESEKTGQQTASQAGALLADARANAAVVLNKCRRHVPAMLSPEL